MSRKKWNSLSEEQKKKLYTKIMDKWDKLTEISPDLDNALDIFEAITDHTKDLFECNLDCSDCTLEDLKKCVQNFRQANIFMLGKIKTYEQGLEMFLTGLNLYVKTLLKILKYQIEDEDEEPEEEIPEQGDSVDGLYA